MTLPEFEIIDITPDNEQEYDLFCKKSKKKEEGYQKKLSWFQKRYAEGLRMKILRVREGNKFTSRGFVEYIPGEYAWRAVKASDYMFIHCLWVVGKHKKKGYGKMLLDLVIKDAKEQGFAGVAMVTSDQPWLTGKKLFIKNGFEIVDTAEPKFELIVKKFKDTPDPAFPKNWVKRFKKYSEGLTVFYTDQCPYLPDAVKIVVNAGENLGIPVTTVELKSAKDVQQKSPTAFGIFGIVYKGELLRYYYMSTKELVKELQS
ncbi:MAG: GNAT family N-acetyltransferase [Candidatus Thorarchaeota archaeon]|jgi:ribosomal protein S18 acetylase RimI-like enzyme